MRPETDELIPTRRSLLSRLKDLEDQEGWQQFFDTYWKLIYAVAVKAGFPDAEAQDVVQETMISVAGQMPSFCYDSELGSFKNWLLLITRRRIADHLRRKYREPKVRDLRVEPETGTGTIEQVPDSEALAIEAIWDAEWHRHILDAAMQRVRRRVDPKLFQLFDCYVVKQWPVADVVRTFGVNAGQVYLAKHRVSALVRQEVERLETRAI